MDTPSQPIAPTGRPQAVRRLRALSFLSPGIPRDFFALVVERLSRDLGCAIELDVDSRTSGPMGGDEDPFAAGAADIGFLCSPSYLYLRAQASPSVDLVPAGFVFGDRRARGRPVYFSDVVVRCDHPARSFAELAGRVWGYNDECSLSGYFAALQRLLELGCGSEFFARRVQTGSHHASIEALLTGAIDGAAIDSTVFSLELRRRPELAEALRVLESWGPFPIQPIVVRSALGPDWAPRVAAALLRPDAVTSAALAAFGLERCVPIDDTAYAEERRALVALGQIPAAHVAARIAR